MNLSTLTLAQLKTVAANKNICPAGDKRKKQTWIDAIQTQKQNSPISELSEEMDAYFEQDITLAELGNDGLTENERLLFGWLTADAPGALPEKLTGKAAELEQTLLKEVTQGGDRPIVLGDWLGHEYYDIISQHAITAIVEDNRLLKELYTSACDYGIEVSPEWHKLHNDPDLVCIKDENADIWASFNARRTALGL